MLKTKNITDLFGKDDIIINSKVIKILCNGKSKNNSSQKSWNYIQRTYMQFSYTSEDHALGYQH